MSASPNPSNAPGFGVPEDHGDTSADFPSSAKESEDFAVPRIKRGPIFGRLAAVDMFRIALFGMMLYAVIALRKPCAQGAENFLLSFDPPPEGTGKSGAASLEDVEFIELTPEEIRKRFPSAAEIESGAAGSEKK